MELNLTIDGLYSHIGCASIVSGLHVIYGKPEMRSAILCQLCYHFQHSFGHSESEFRVPGGNQQDKYKAQPCFEAKPDIVLNKAEGAPSSKVVFEVIIQTKIPTVPGVHDLKLSSMVACISRQGPKIHIVSAYPAAQLPSQTQMQSSGQHRLTSVPYKECSQNYTLAQ